MYETEYKLLRLIEGHAGLTQRQLAQRLGVSLGKVNYCLNALIERGWVRARNLRKADHKPGYGYLLTARGTERKAAIGVKFLHRKMDEYALLRKEIAQLRREVASRRSGSARP
jgi:EPS-associated MarR family transcriptional regulator